MNVCLVVPSGHFDVGPIVEAIRTHHPDVVLCAVWCGDPHHRPPMTHGVRWCDLALEEPTGAGWGRLIAALPTRSYELARACRAAADRLRSGAPNVLVLRVGSVGVVGPLHEFAPDAGLVAIERAPADLPLDGLVPTPADLARRGRWSTTAFAVARDSVDVFDLLGDAATASAPDDDAAAAVQLSLSGCRDRLRNADGGLVVGWSEMDVPAGSIVDLDDVDAPWCVDIRGERPRVLLSERPGLAAAVASAVPQAIGAEAPVQLPGGIVVDLPIRTLMTSALAAWRRGDGDLPPDPYAADGFVEWLVSPSQRSGVVGRYWFEEWVSRPDLHQVFPDPAGDDRKRFQQWAHDSWRSDGRSALLRAEDGCATDAIERWTDVGVEHGVNVIGYIAADSGLGDFTRRLHRSLDAANVPVSGLHYSRTASPLAADAPALTTELAYTANLITVHGDQMRYFADDHGAEVFGGRTNIGYWFWELSELTPPVVAAIDLVDEVWVATEFIADAYRSVTGKPVRVVPIPVPEPASSSVERADLGLPDDRFVFLVTLDHLSITDRKNPIGAIRAFEIAFPEASDDGPVLVVKTLNGDQRWSEHEELQLAAAARPDVQVVDRHVSRADQMRLIELSDCLVSLHRSEGLGLHLLEAMWLNTPVIATRYSGNLDAMNDDNSILIDADLVPVVDRQGYYPTSAVWAEPRLDDAAVAMRTVFTDPTLGGRLAAQARRDMMNQPSLTHTGHLIARLCRDAADPREE